MTFFSKMAYCATLCTGGNTFRPITTQNVEFLNIYYKIIVSLNFISSNFCFINFNVRLTSSKMVVATFSLPVAFKAIPVGLWS